MMDNFNAIISIIREAMPLIQSGIPALVGGFVTAMFLRGNTNRTEFEKIKAGKINEVLDDLVSSRELTLTELVKCKNILKIAQLADEEYAKRNEKNDFKEQKSEISFEWFLRFFESAGNVCNEDMQLLWAKILAGEASNKGSIPVSLIHTISIIDSKLATSFSILCNYSCVIRYFGQESIVPLIWVLEGEDVNYFYDLGLNFRMLSELDSYGLIKFDYQSGFSINVSRLDVEYFDETMELQSSDGEVRTGSVMLTHMGEALYRLLEKEKEKDDSYFDKCQLFFSKQKYLVTKNSFKSVDISEAANNILFRGMRVCYSLRKNEGIKSEINTQLQDLRCHMPEEMAYSYRNLQFNKLLVDNLNSDNICFKANCKKRKKAP